MGLEPTTTTKWTVDELISEALIDLEISHEKFKTTVEEKEKYD